MAASMEDDSFDFGETNNEYDEDIDTGPASLEYKNGDIEEW
jgi:hypothetical protein